MGAASYIIGLVVAIACAFGCRTLAANKGRGTTLWTILGFFFGLIALLIIALLPKKTTL